jgi:single-strand DNA-binding protein
MTMIASIHGRAAADPVARVTKSGKDMTTVHLAVDVTGRDAEEQETLWIGLLAFGTAAGELLRASKGEMVAAMGRMTRGVYTPANGEQRESWSMLADSVVVAKSAKPSGKARSQGEPARGQQPRTQDQHTEREPFYSDEIPFG